MSAPSHNFSHENRMKTCNKCSKKVKLHISCFKCPNVYHAKCFLKVPTMCINERGQIFCCQNLTSKYNSFENKSQKQENQNGKGMEGGVYDSDNDVVDLEYSRPEQDKYENDQNTCDTSFNKDNAVEEVNGDGGDFVCSFCEVIFLMEKPYREHVELCDRNNLRLNKTRADIKFKRMYKCVFKNCKCILSRNTSQVKHCNCRMCAYTTSSKRNLQQHILRMHCKEEDLFKCNDCTYMSRQKGHLKRHIFTHLGLKPFSNPTGPNEIRRHATVNKKKNTHSSTKTLKCSFKKCIYKTSKITYLQKHIKRHSNRGKYKCNDCAYSSHEKGALRDHILSVHLGEKFVCDTCGFASGYKRNLSSHITKKHSNPEIKIELNG